MFFCIFSQSSKHVRYAGKEQDTNSEQKYLRQINSNKTIWTV
jgi:hypothetical protein